VIPPLIGLAFVIAVLAGPSRGVGVVAGALAAVLGLYWDAMKRQRAANDMLADALADGRVKSPALERLESVAQTIATRPKVEAMRKAAGEAAKALGDALTIGDQVDSAPSRIHAFSQAVANARRLVAPIDATFPAQIIEDCARTLKALERADALWRGDAREDLENWADEARRSLEEARARFAAFRRAAREELERISVVPPQA
jgi:hypothetical protein